MLGDSENCTIIRSATLADTAGIVEIYNHYITQTVVTFEEESVTDVEIARRLELVWSASFPWLVAEEHGHVVGYAYANRWNIRTGYRFTAEVTVYLAPAHVGRGVGSKLYGRLFSILQSHGIRGVIGGIALPNEASVALHEKFSLRKVAHFQAVGVKFDRWIDVGYWQRIFQPIEVHAPDGGFHADAT